MQVPEWQRHRQVGGRTGVGEGSGTPGRHDRVVRGDARGHRRGYPGWRWWSSRRCGRGRLGGQGWRCRGVGRGWSGCCGGRDAARRADRGRRRCRGGRVTSAGEQQDEPAHEADGGARDPLRDLRDETQSRVPAPGSVSPHGRCAPFALARSSTSAATGRRATGGVSRWTCKPSPNPALRRQTGGKVWTGLPDRAS
jgi:hypothetical protein